MTAKLREARQRVLGYSACTIYSRFIETNKVVTESSLAAETERRCERNVDAVKFEVRRLPDANITCVSGVECFVTEIWNDGVPRKIREGSRNKREKADAEETPAAGRDSR